MAEWVPIGIKYQFGFTTISKKRLERNYSYSTFISNKPDLIHVADKSSKKTNSIAMSSASLFQDSVEWEDSNE